MRNGTLARLATAAALVLFLLLFFITNTLDTTLFRPGYYTGVLDETHAYDRAYDELARDPALSPIVGDLTGGFDLGEESLLSGLTGVAAPFALELAVEDAIANFIAYLKNHERLTLSLDVTDFVTGIPGSAIGALLQELGALPEEQTSSYDELKAKSTSAVKETATTGKPPKAVPAGSVPPNRKQDFVSTLFSAAGLDEAEDEDEAEEIRADVQRDDVPAAVRRSIAVGAEPRAEASAAEVAGGRFIRTVERDGETRYLLGPPADITKQIEDAFRITHLIAWAAGWGRWVSATIAIGLLVLLASLARPSGAAMLRWTGWPLMIAGGVTAVGWLIAQWPIRAKLLSLTADKAASIAPSYEDLVGDVVRTAVENLNLPILAPAGAVFATGFALVALSYRARPARPGPGGTV